MTIRFLCDKPGARVRAYDDRLELVTGVRLGKKTHVSPWSAVTGLSTEGFGGSKLVVTTTGRRYEFLDVGRGRRRKSAIGCFRSLNARRRFFG